MMKMNTLGFSIFMLCLALVIGSEDATLGMDQLNLGSSCNDIYQRNPFSRGRTSKYWIATKEGVYEVACNMKLKCGGVEGGWMQVIDIDMDRDDSCPGKWYKVKSPRGLCLGHAATCVPTHFYVKGVSYDICGQAKAYQRH